MASDGVVIGEAVRATERELVTEALRGEAAGQIERAFACHVEASLDRSCALAAVILGDRSEAEDVVHDAVCMAWRGLDGLRDPERMEAWFTRIVVNACRDQLRRRRVRPITLDLPASLPASDSTTDLATLDALERAMAELSPEHRAVIALRFWADLSLEEIAERTGERLGTVKSRIHYALGHLRTAWERETSERRDAR